MRILFDYRPALRQRTGVGEYVHEMAVALAATGPAGGDVTLFSSSWKDRLPETAVPTLPRVDTRVPVRALNYAWHRLGWPPVEWLAGSFDIVQSAHPLPIPSRRAAQVVTGYDLDFLDHPDRTHAEIRRDYPTLVPRAIPQVDHIFVISPHTAREFEHRLGARPDRITICTPGAPDWPRRDEEPADGYLLFLGTLEPRKNLGVLLDAYEQLLQRETSSRVPPLMLAGGIPPAAATIVERTQRAPLAGRVMLPGYIESARRQEIYRGAIAVVLPSHTEGFGMTAVEAMTVGVPVVAANRGALPDTVGAAGLQFDPTNAGELAHALEQIIDSRPLRDRLREAGWAHARQFNWRTSAERMRAAWHDVVARRKHSHG